MASHDAVAHAWANQTGKNRKGFNVYYSGDTIYSYGSHFPIARLVQDVNGRTVVLFTTDSHSVSTAKHKTITRRACRHLTTFDVPLVMARDQDAQRYNAESYIRRISELIDKASRAWAYGALHLSAAQNLAAELDDYARAFRFDGWERFTGLGLEQVNEQAAEARRRADAHAAEMERRRREQEAEQRKRYREEGWPAIKTWLRGGDVDRRAWYRYTTRPLPRITGDVVETSWGASVPLNDALAAYRLAVQCRRAKKSFKPSGLERKVGDFALREIKPNGDLVVGCHDIPFWFMRYAACRNGITVPNQELAA